MTYTICDAEEEEFTVVYLLYSLVFHSHWVKVWMTLAFMFQLQ